MTSVEYLNCSFAGSYYVDCEILAKLDDDKFIIRYTDPDLDEVVTETVTKDYLKFPKFSDLAV